MQFNCKVMPTNDTEYNCHTKVVELLNHTGSISCHTPLLLLIALRVGTQTHIHTLWIKSIFLEIRHKPICDWLMPGLERLLYGLNNDANYNGAPQTQLYCLGYFQSPLRMIKEGEIIAGLTIARSP